MASPANIVCPNGTLLDVEAWANAEFPRSFTPLYNMKNPQYVQLRHYDGVEKDGKVVMQPVSILAVPIGETNADVSVSARLAQNGDVELFTETAFVEDMAAEGLVVATGVKDTKDICFYMPFKCPIEADSPASVDRLESLIRWYYLVGGIAYAVQGCLGYFKAHFRDACRDIARAVGAVEDDEDEGADNNIPADTPPDLIADTDVAGPSDNRATTSAFNKRIHAMDDTYHDFKSSLLKQFIEMQTADRNEMAQLRARNQELQRLIPLLNENQTRLTEELEVRKGKLKTAEQDAVNWKVQYEGLKKTLECALVKEL